jgi:3-dehydro-L-gulonate 2-dehydrogenase
LGLLLEFCPYFKITMTGTILIQSTEMQSTFQKILERHAFEKSQAVHCANIFTESSVDGIYTHGVNRFPRFIEYVQKGYIKPGAEPSLIKKIGNIEQWNGNLGPGPLNAYIATERVMQLAKESAIACVALSNTNHWMRGGSYGWQAAKKGFVFIGFTNTIANMPAWGALDQKLGNNPLVIAVPYKEEAIVLDMAMSQYSFGAMETAVMKGEQLSVAGGFDRENKLTQNPADILATRRPLSIGYWKGAGLALLLDILAALLSNGLSTHEISQKETEHSVSQVFIAIDLSKLGEQSIIQKIISDYLQSIPMNDKTKITYPGQRVIETRKINKEKGIPVLNDVWERVLQL